MFVRGKLFTAVLVSLLVFSTSSYAGGSRWSAKLSNTLKNSYLHNSSLVLAALLAGSLLIPPKHQIELAIGAVENVVQRQQSIVQNAEPTQVSERIPYAVEEIISSDWKNDRWFRANHRLLWLMSYYGDVGSVQHVSQNLLGNNPRQTSYALHIAMDYAIRGGHLNVVKYLHTQESWSEKALSHFLLEAARNAHWETMRYLVDRGAKLYSADDYEADIQSEVANFREDFEELLYLIGDSVDTRNETALQLLRAAGAEVSYFNFIMEGEAEDGDLDGVKLLHTAGADDLNRALLAAVDNVEYEAGVDDILEIAEFLIAKGADDIVGAMRKVNDQLQDVDEDGNRLKFMELTDLLDYFKSKHLEKLLR